MQPGPKALVRGRGAGGRSTPHLGNPGQGGPRLQGNVATNLCSCSYTYIFMNSIIRIFIYQYIFMYSYSYMKIHTYIYIYNLIYFKRKQMKILKAKRCLVLTIIKYSPMPANSCRQTRQGMASRTCARGAGDQNGNCKEGG